MENKRWGDPKAWECLNDEQRDIIDEWYKQVSESDKKPKEQEKRCRTHSYYFALIPFAVGYAHQFLGNTWLSTLEFIVQIAAAWLVYSIIFHIFSDFYFHFNYLTTDDGYEKIPKLRVAFQVILAVVVSWGVTAWFSR